MTNESKPPEPAGAERFRALTPSAPAKMPPPAVTGAQLSIELLETRVSELEAVVHTVAQYSRAAEHEVVVPWIQRVRARVTQWLEGK